MDSAKAKALASKGAEVVKCDLAIKEDVKNAIKGADIAWIVTNFWDPVSIKIQVFLRGLLFNNKKFNDLYKT